MRESVSINKFSWMMPSKLAACNTNGCTTLRVLAHLTSTIFHHPLSNFYDLRVGRPNKVLKNLIKTIPMSTPMSTVTYVSCKTINAYLP